ncbi:restriction endonuclease subunit S [ANME-1 cluster archaeon AG-394-G21]|nr:restriction endonuclease subunit S [ANME-1 cluster archaeon AG-394-G21]
MKPYLKYKDSGIEWIGEIPEHWKIVKLKRATQFLYGESLSNENRLEGKVPVYGSNGVTGYHNEAITKSPCIVIGRKGSFGKVNYSDKECFPIDTTFYIDTTATHNDLLWLYYLLLTVRLDSFSKDSAVPGLNREEAYERIISLPPFSEQQTIANYLDRKTRQIDTLIENKQKQIDLLKEQRAAIINQAVTKGLDPAVKQKDSGIEWLGEIPEHWAVKKLKYTIRLINEKVENEDKYELLIALENIEGFTGKLLNGSSSFEGSGNTFKKGDVLFNKLRPYLCKVVLTPQDGVAVGELLVFRPNDPINNRFLFYRILSTDFISIVNGSTYGAKMPRASWEFIRNLKIPLSPIIEQQTIVDYLDAQTTIMDESIEKRDKQIEHLKEYRTAFISEVVTGKIDVRDSGIPEVRHS